MENNVIGVLSFLVIIIALIVLIIKIVQDYSNQMDIDMYEEEFVGQIIDIFEDFLAEKKVNLYNTDKQDKPNEAIIYGNDYNSLAKKIRVLMGNWNVTYDVKKK